MRYIYQLTIRPFGIGTQPDGCMGHTDDGSRFGCVSYNHPLSESDVKTFSLIPITEALALAGRTFEVPFGPDMDIYHVDHISEDGVIHYHVNDEDTLTARYYEFMHLIEQ